MTSDDRRVVLDASAMIAWVRHEVGWNIVARTLSVASLPASALTESLYRARERGSTMSAPELYDALTAMGVAIEPVTAEDAIRAAELIEVSRAARKPGGSSLSLGDGLCIAVAERLDLTVTGGDLHWATLDLRVKFLPFR